MYKIENKFFYLFLLIVLGLFSACGSSSKKSKEEEKLEVPKLKSLEVKYHNLNTDFNKENTEYETLVKSHTPVLVVSAEAEIGSFILHNEERVNKLEEEEKKIKNSEYVEIRVANDKNIRTYKIKIEREEPRKITGEYSDEKITLCNNTEHRGAFIYYTEKDEEPTVDSEQYTSPIAFPKGQLEFKIKARLFSPQGEALSEVKNFTCTRIEEVLIQYEKGTFYMGKYPVSQEEFKAVMGENPSYFKGSNVKKHPVENVSFLMAVEYCNELSRRSGLDEYYNSDGSSVSINRGANGFRLPSSEEWLYAASGGKNGINTLYAGSNNIDMVAWYGGNLDTKDFEYSFDDRYIHNHKNGHGGRTDYVNVSNPLSSKSTRPVGMRNSNELGLYDMSGNVWEWTHSFGRDREGRENEYLRILHGGSWLSNAKNCTVDSMRIEHIREAHNQLGFRVVRNKI